MDTRQRYTSDIWGTQRSRWRQVSQGNWGSRVGARGQGKGVGGGGLIQMCWECLEGPGWHALKATQGHVCAQPGPAWMPWAQEHIGTSQMGRHAGARQGTAAPASAVRSKQATKDQERMGSVNRV